jgi:hypothetical protein
VAHNNIGAEGASSISKALVHNKSLQLLELGFNPIGGKVVSEFLRDLKENTILEHIDLRCTKAGEEIFDEIKRLVRIREPLMQQAGLRMVILFSTTTAGK